MPEVFLSEALQAQAQAQGQNQMLQEFLSEKVARQIIGNIARHNAARETSRQAKTGRSLGQAADRESQRDVGRTRFEMAKENAKMQKTMGLITAAASAAGALGAYYASQPDLEAGLGEAVMPGYDEMTGGAGMHGGDWGDQMTGAELTSGGTVADVLEKAEYAEQVADIPLAQELAEGPSLTPPAAPGEFTGDTDTDLTDEEFQDLLGGL